MLEEEESAAEIGRTRDPQDLCGHLLCIGTPGSSTLLPLLCPSKTASACQALAQALPAPEALFLAVLLLILLPSELATSLRVF